MVLLLKYTPDLITSHLIHVCKPSPNPHHFFPELLQGQFACSVWWPHYLAAQSPHIIQSELSKVLIRSCHLPIRGFPHQGLLDSTRSGPGLPSNCILFITLKLNSLFFSFPQIQQFISVSESLTCCSLFRKFLSECSLLSSFCSHLITLSKRSSQPWLFNGGPPVLACVISPLAPIRT